MTEPAQCPKCGAASLVKLDDPTRTARFMFCRNCERSGGVDDLQVARGIRNMQAVMTERAPSQGETVPQEWHVLTVVNHHGERVPSQIFERADTAQMRANGHSPEMHAEVVPVVPKSSLDAAEERIKQLELSLAFESVDPERFENSWMAMDEKQRLEAMTTHRNRLAEILERTEQQLAAERARADAAEAAGVEMRPLLEDRYRELMQEVSDAFESANPTYDKIQLRDAIGRALSSGVGKSASDELRALRGLLAEVYRQAGNHAQAERRHALTPALRDAIRDTLAAQPERAERSEP